MNESDTHSIKKTDYDKQSSANVRENDTQRNNSGQSNNWYNSTEFMNNLSAVIPKKVSILEDPDQVKEFISQEDDVSQVLSRSK